MKFTEPEINELLKQHLGAPALVRRLKEHQWNTEEDAAFVGTVVGKFIIDLMAH